MPITISTFADRPGMGQAAAENAAQRINQAIEAKGAANVILATGSSQFEMLSHLITKEVDWSKVNVFHLDEYAGLDSTHPASFVGYLKQRFESKVNDLKSFTFINGTASDHAAECERLGQLILTHVIDVACIGIGENGHIAFNDPPADFETESPYILVELDEACRLQQVGEGWFPDLESVPTHAISMSVKQIMKSACLIVTVPDERKAKAVHDSVSREVSPEIPASILQQHSDCHLFLDEGSAKLLVDG